ncbi:hypothetical protein [Limnoglobus roseus]|uniref:Uncharacterized protein n=1 Tax=Limnoglobus roseus TaxID=2598579 RepID=A0A5C1ADC2_9BACT|nr:hypothetical protein [Limnoglobus roseus]QEL16213.1 hypothetical protein PX52LOC_03153 [Limnoglobus roseus]
MCNINNNVQAATTAQTTKPQRSVEEMLRDIAFVLRMTRQVKAEMRRERAEAEVEVLCRTTKREELVAVSM